MPYKIDNSLNMSDTTCEIYAAAFLLKTKLIHYVNHNKTDTGNNTDTKCVNPSDVNIIQLFDKVHIYLEIIANTLWQIYVRKYNIHCAYCLFTFLCRTY